MRRSGLYLQGAYAGYAGKAEESKVWKETRSFMAKRGIAGFLLVILTVHAVMQRAADAAGRHLGESWAQAGGQASEEIADGIYLHVLESAEESKEEEFSKEKETKHVWGAEKDPADTLIVLDPGHGGKDEGGAANGVREKDINLKVAFALRNHLQEMGYQVVLTRTADEELSLLERAKRANDAGADLCVSIHQNTSEESGAQGIEVWYSGAHAGEESDRLSSVIEKFAVENTGAQEREIRREEELYVIRECHMPSCLVETGFLTNPAECKKLADPEYQDKIAQGIAAGIDLYLHPRTMYLTFDDGPSEENTNAVLDILKERNIKATFFLVGENVEKHPEVAWRIAAEGHTIGIHCYSHDYGMLYESVDSYTADFEKARAVVQKITGVDAKLFRFPGGSINSFNKGVYEDIAREMTERGYIYYDWNASLEDAVAHADPQVLLENALSSTLGRKKVVMLAHDVVYQTTLCLEELLDRLPEYRMEPLTEEVEPVQF